MDEELRRYQNITAFGGTALSSDSNVITVNIAESVKTEDEISFIKKVIAEESKMNDPAIIVPTELELYAKVIKSNQSPEQHKCRKQNCNLMFNTLTQRALHETHQHRNASRHIKCTLCNDTFENFFALTRHMSDHRDVRSYVCPHCSINFYTYQDLQIHWKASDACMEAAKSMQQNDKKAVTSRNKLVKEPETIKFSKNSSSNFSNTCISLPQPLAYEQEVKAFAAKYQLKTARKRTSAFTVKPVLKGRKRIRIDYDIEPKYAVPMAARNSIRPFQNLKIKEEPIDDEDMSLDFTNQIEIKNEPHDDYDNSMIANFIVDREVPELMPVNQHWSDTEPLTTELNEKNANENQFPLNDVQPLVATFSEKDIDRTMQTLETIVKPGQQTVRPHTKVMLSKANLLSMKNVKILKLGPSAKIVKFSPSTSQVGSPEERKLDEPKRILSALVKLDIESPKTFEPDHQIKAEPKSNDFETTLPPYSDIRDDTDNKGNVILNAVEDILQNHPLKRNLPKWLIRYMEEQPQKRKIIDDLQRQFLHATLVMKSRAPTLIKNDMAAAIPNEKPIINALPTASETTTTITTAELLPQQPESFFLKVTDSFDKELMVARRQFERYYYAWICPMCYKEYTQKHTFINHLIGTHKITNEKLKTLTVEVKPFLAVKPEQNLSSTQKREDDEVLKHRFECPKCKRTYVTKQSIIAHQNTDCGRLPLYVCKVCSKPFASQSTLNCHKSIHTGELRYKCKYCDKQFRTNGQVRVHLRMHTGEKPFKCQICTLAFRHRETLISHLSRHMDIKRYICNGCDKRFSTISALTTHRNVRPKTCGSTELNTQAVGPLIRVTQGQIKFEPQSQNNVRTRRKLCEEILNEIQNIPKIKKEPEQQEQQSSPLLNEGL